MPETEKLMAEQAARTGETPDALVWRKLGERASTEQTSGSVDWEAVRAIQARARTRPILDPRPWWDIRAELYDE